MLFNGLFRNTQLTRYLFIGKAMISAVFKYQLAFFGELVDLFAEHSIQEAGVKTLVITGFRSGGHRYYFLITIAGQLAENRITCCGRKPAFKVLDIHFITALP